MNKTLAAWIIGLSAMATAAQAGAEWHSGYVDTARVVSATPIYKTVRVYRPVEECWSERVVRPGYRSRTPTIAGAIVGGVIGNQFGKGSGNTAMTVAGSLLGASIGRDAGRYHGGHGYVTRERRCETVDHYDSEEQLVGYRVKYRYKGQTFVTRTREHPGKRIPVRIDVEPVEDYTGGY